MGYLTPSPMVHAEGLAWPLHTFLDSHGFELRPEVAECRNRYEGAVEIVDDRFEVRRELEARHLDWHAVIAVKACSKVCEGCGLSFDPEAEPIHATGLVRDETGRILPHESRVFTVNWFETDFCEDCQAGGDWCY